jgi:hypothetical protein
LDFLLLIDLKSNDVLFAADTPNGVAAEPSRRSPRI